MKEFKPLPLVCTYQPHEAVRDARGNVLRRMFVGPVCCRPAPRGAGSAPLYPNRFGDPLCEKHRHKRLDPFAFPEGEKDDSSGFSVFV